MPRKIKQLSDAIESLLIKQIAHELKNFTLYKSFANYFAVAGLMDLEDYYNERAGEEKLHHDWIYEYLTDADSCFIYPAIPQNDGIEINDIVDPFKATVDREIETTDLIYAIKKQAELEEDYMTIAWLDKLLIPEQIEEESISRTALDIIKHSDSIAERSDQINDLVEGRAKVG